MRQFLPPLQGNQLWQVTTEDILNYLSWRYPLLESLSGDSHNTVSNALRAYDRLVLMESQNIHFNQ
jgi:hypothetical protein